jgi:CrcB protein
VALVFIGGFLGTLARYGVVDRHPASTRSVDATVLLINLSGALILGILGTSLFTRRPSWVGLRLSLATGLLGGWTTYSAVIAGALLLSHDHATAAGLTTLVLELIVPVLGAGLGLLLGSLLTRARP